MQLNITSHLVKNFDIGINGNLYGGRMLDWIDESGALYCKIVFKNENFVTYMIDKTVFHKTVGLGEILTFYAENLKIKTHSISFDIIVKRINEIVLTTKMVFVCVDEKGIKKEIN